MKRIDLYSFVQPLMTASVSSHMLSPVHPFTAAFLLLPPKPVSIWTFDYLCDSSTWMSQRCPKSGVQRESFCAPNMFLLSNHSTIHRVPRTGALQSCSSPHLPIPEELRPVTSASFFRLCFLLSIPTVTTQARPLPSCSWITAIIFQSCICSTHSPC